MKKVLILTCSTGEGHNSAAHAIEKSLCNHGYNCELKDSVSFQSARVNKIVSSLYNDTIKKAPAVFGAVYKLGDLYCSAKLPSPVYWANAHYAEVLREYIESNNFDAVVCTHLYGMEAMTAILKDLEFKIPCYGVMTDYVCIPFLEETQLTGYFVPSEEARQCLISKGISEDTIMVSGIPVDESFCNHPAKSEARLELGIPEDKKVFLIMTGGIGCENMESLCKRLHNNLPANGMMIVLTGKNDDLKSRLDKKYTRDSRLQTVAFTGKVALYMAAADVLLSKPGGLSSTEAAVANIPLVHIHEIPGCETYNAKFFAEHGMSLRANDEQEAVDHAISLASDPDKAEQMRKMQLTYIHQNASDLIVKAVSSQWGIRD